MEHRCRYLGPDRLRNASIVFPFNEVPVVEEIEIAVIMAFSSTTSRKKMNQGKSKKSHGSGASGIKVGAQTARRAPPSKKQTKGMVERKELRRLFIFLSLLIIEAKRSRSKGFPLFQGGGFFPSTKGGSNEVS